MQMFDIHSCFLCLFTGAYLPPVYILNCRNAEEAIAIAKEKLAQVFGKDKSYALRSVFETEKIDIPDATLSEEYPRVLVVVATTWDLRVG